MIFIFALFMFFMLAGCNVMQNDQSKENMDTVDNAEDVAMVDIVLTEEIMELEDDLSAVRYEGNYGFDKFLSGGSAGLAFKADITTTTAIRLLLGKTANVDEAFALLI